jgi:RNA polymerase sigma-70 factor (ECF subfamily)
MMTMPLEASASARTGPGYENAALAARAARGDHLAFSLLLERNYDMIHRVAWRWCGNATDADDIAQDVSIKLARAIRTWRGEAAFTTWLYRIVLNSARDRQRSLAAEKRRIEAYAAQALVDAQGSDTAEDDPAVRLWNAAGRLPDKQRDAVLLVHGEGMTHGEAAAVMGVGEGTVSFHIHEAKKKLRAMLLKPEDNQS